VQHAELTCHGLARIATNAVFHWLHQEKKLVAAVFKNHLLSHARIAHYNTAFLQIDWYSHSSSNASLQPAGSWHS
jgi:hypothetical protein